VTKGLWVERQAHLLAMVDVLRTLAPGEVENLARRSSVARLETGETFDMTEDRRALFLLLSGRVRVFEPNHGGQDLTLSVVEGGTVLGQSGFSTRRLSRVEALEPSVVRFVGWEDFEDLARRNPEVGVLMVRLLSERLGVCEDRLSELVRKEVSARLASLLLRFSEYQGILVRDGSRKIPVRFTHRQLASMVGANREAVTRSLKTLRDTGSVEVRDRHIHVIDTEALERLAEATR
jgi:CRP/FNR family transcriptional regulator, cyclic AMP receptor protein